MKRILMIDDTYRNLVDALVELEVLLTIEKSSDDKVKRLLSIIKLAQDVNVIEQG